MGWLQRLFGIESPGTEAQQMKMKRSSSVQGSQMSPGLTGQYDWDLREKAGQHEPPVVPEKMGLEGEFDVQGLAKRVAAAFDAIPELRSVETATLKQDGSRIVLEGSVPDQETFDRLVEVASEVDGTKSVDAGRLAIGS
ncbi:BON domain-containing protein [Leptolyngbya ohadii]|uniref:BON domain-containing protein n=1 Tax=Leptolyngbya ohadii TaxID=1962290 RepID=UPI000B59F89B|nr:BON domain-containing protein [Leptolyngbya ohadii]